MKPSKENPDRELTISRRDFIRTSMAAGTGLLMTGPSILHGQAASSITRDLKVAIIGTGSQGRVLLEACAGIPNIQFVAVCDMWEYSLKYGQGILRKRGFKPNPYEDYQEMLSKETDLDAVIIATPDFMHAEQTNACLRAGINVYCEKMMSNSIDGARSMVQTARDTGKLLQVGHQRRSNPRYLHAKHRMLGEAQLLGRITHINGQWNRAVGEDLGWPNRQEIKADKLARFGYENMHQFRNWRWFKRYSGGPISDLGAHQIDIYNWFLGSTPKSIMASGGLDYYKDRDWYDNAMVVYEYETARGPVRASYQVLTTTSAGGGYFEYFMGTEGSLRISENPAYTAAFREANAPEWDKHLRDGIVRMAAPKNAATPTLKPWEKPRPGQAAAAATPAVVDVRETAALSEWELPVQLDKAIHQPHLENFFDAIRNGTALNSPGEVGLETLATVLKVNDAIAAERKLPFEPAEFRI